MVDRKVCRSGAGRVVMALGTGLVFLAAALPMVWFVSCVSIEEWQVPLRTVTVMLAGISFVWGAGAGLLLNLAWPLARIRPPSKDRTAGRLFVAALVLSLLGVLVCQTCLVVLGLALSAD